MCHGHPRFHPCSHTSMSWFLCTTASCDLTNGTSEPCAESSLAPDQGVKTDCPLRTCMFKQKGPEWKCCQCQQGPNTNGWCTMLREVETWDSSGRKVKYMTTCDHGCCEDCTGVVSSSTSQNRSGGKKRSHGISSSSTSTSSSKKSYSRKKSSSEHKSRSYANELVDQYTTNDFPNFGYDDRSEHTVSSRSSKSGKSGSKSRHVRTY